MTSLSVTATEGALINSDLFGGNIIFNRTGSNEIGETYANAIEDLGVTTLRYPGGSVTEHFFDINDPDRDVAAHADTGEVMDVVPLSDFMIFSEVNGHDVTLVLPTRHYLSDETDENGNRFADVGEDDLRDFVRDVVSGHYGDATIRTLEIGNEYWHSGQMNAIEYGRVANDMINIIDDELALIAEEFPQAEDIEIGVQMGVDYQYGNMSDDYDGVAAADVVAELEDDYGYTFGTDVYWGGGEVNFHHVANHMIISELQSGGSFDKADGVIAHVYSFDTDFSRTFALDQVDQTWQSFDKEFEVYATEWNLKGTTDLLKYDEDYGLNSANEMLNIVETFASFDVDSANVWPLLQATDSALVHEHGSGAQNPSAAMFSWLSEALPGKKMLDFNTDERHKTEADFGDYKVHGFADTEELVLYVASEHTDGNLNVNLDLSQLVTGYGDVTIDILGVEEGSKPFTNRSDAEIESLEPESFLVDGNLTVSLDPGEIVQIKMQGYQPTETLTSALQDDEITVDLIDDVGDDGDFFSEEDESSGLEDDDGFAGGMAWLLGVLPLLALLGMG